MRRDELGRVVDEFTLTALETGSLAAAGALPAGVRALDLWRSDSYGSMLFWIDAEHRWLAQFDQAVLHHADAQRFQDGRWRVTGGGGHLTDPPDQILAGRGTGLHRLGGATRDPLRLTIGVATPGISAIALRDSAGSHERPVGESGFFVLGITYEDPITYAYAINQAGQVIESEPILL